MLPELDECFHMIVLCWCRSHPSRCTGRFSSWLYFSTSNKQAQLTLYFLIPSPPSCADSGSPRAASSQTSTYTADVGVHSICMTCGLATERETRPRQGRTRIGRRFWDLISTCVVKMRWMSAEWGRKYSMELKLTLPLILWWYSDNKVYYAHRIRY